MLAKLEEKKGVSDLKFVTLRIKTVTVRTQGEDFTPAQIRTNNRFPFGLYQGHCDIMGVIDVWKLPEISDQNFQGLHWAIKNIAHYEIHAEKYAKLIQSDPIVKWHLIPFLVLPDQLDIFKTYPQLSDIAPWATDLLNNRKLFHRLANWGAQYKHYLAYAYQQVYLGGVVRMVYLFDVDATRKWPGDEGNYIARYLTFGFYENTFKKVELLLATGFNINERIDQRFQNTILHYLVALESPDRAEALIDLCERLSVAIDYTLQDRQGKTVLYLATALNQPTIVNKLLNLLRTKKKDIGLNIPDQHGRTPLMVAAALGRIDILKELIKDAKISVRDQFSNDVRWYMQAPLEIVAELLGFVSMNPDRCATFESQSYLCDLRKDSPPLVLVDEQGKEHLLLLSGKEPYYRRLIIARDFLDPKHPLHAHISLHIKCLSTSQVTIAESCYSQRQTNAPRMMMLLNIIKESNDKIVEKYQMLKPEMEHPPVLSNYYSNTRFSLFAWGAMRGKSNTAIDLTNEVLIPKY